MGLVKMITTSNEYSGEHALLRSLRVVEHEKVKASKPGPEIIKLFSCSTQLSTKFQLLIKTKILTNKGVSCFKYYRCCIYHANKC